MNTFREAGLRPTDVSRLLKISRTAVSLWFNGHSQPHPLIKDRVRQLEKAVSAAHKAGALPLIPGVPRRERHLTIERIVRQFQ